MRTRPRPAWSTPLAIVVVALVAGCSSRGRPGGREEAKPEPIAAPPPDSSAAPKNEVERYTGMEKQNGQGSIRQTVTARKGANAGSSVVATLYPGTVVSHVARLGDFHLVAWTSVAGPQQGWVDGNLAFQARWLDSGDARPKPARAAASR